MTTKEKLYLALKMHMEWIGPPPKDKHSYDSLREDAWHRGQDAMDEYRKARKE